jgi:hypothetical protein
MTQWEVLYYILMKILYTYETSFKMCLNEN